MKIKQLALLSSLLMSMGSIGATEPEPSAFGIDLLAISEHGISALIPGAISSLWARITDDDFVKDIDSDYQPSNNLGDLYPSGSFVGRDESPLEAHKSSYGIVGDAIGLPAMMAKADHVFAQASVDSFARAFTKASGEEAYQAFVKPTLEDSYEKFVKPSLQRGLQTVLIGVACSVTTWFASKLIWQWIEGHLNRPRLDFKVTRAPATLGGSVHDKPLEVVFEPGVTNRLNYVCQMTALIKNKIMTGEPSAYRNLLLYGPPGSGKHGIAKKIADYCQMEFFEIAASAFIKFKDADAARAIEDFFAKEVNKTTQGAIVFIDNASMFFSKRKNSDASVRMVTAFIEQLQKRSDKYMVILSMTTKPTHTDETAVLFPDEIAISRPGLVERTKILVLYRDKFFLSAKGLSPALLNSARESLSDEKLDEIARKLTKALPAELHSFMEALRLEASLPSEGLVTADLIDRIVARWGDKYQELIS